MKCYVCGKDEGSMPLRRRDSRGRNYHGALKCKICSKNVELKDRFDNYYNVRTYYEQITMNFEKITKSPDGVKSKAKEVEDNEGEVLSFTNTTKSY